MARFGLAERMEEVEASMFAEDNDNIVDGVLKNTKLTDKDVFYLEGQGVSEDKTNE